MRDQRAILLVRTRTRDRDRLMSTAVRSYRVISFLARSEDFFQERGGDDSEAVRLRVNRASTAISLSRLEPVCTNTLKSSLTRTERRVLNAVWLSGRKLCGSMS